MNDTDKDKIIAVLRAEVLAWRESRTSINYDEWRDAVEAAIAATNAANALEGK